MSEGTPNRDPFGNSSPGKLVSEAVRRQRLNAPTPTTTHRSDVRKVCPDPCPVRSLRKKVRLRRSRIEGHCGSRESGRSAVARCRRGGCVRITGRARQRSERSPNTSTAPDDRSRRARTTARCICARTPHRRREFRAPTPSRTGARARCGPAIALIVQAAVSVRCANCLGSIPACWRPHDLRPEHIDRTEHEDEYPIPPTSTSRTTTTADRTVGILAGAGLDGRCGVAYPVTLGDSL